MDISEWGVKSMVAIFVGHDAYCKMVCDVTFVDCDVELVGCLVVTVNNIQNRS